LTVPKYVQHILFPGPGNLYPLPTTLSGTARHVWLTFSKSDIVHYYDVSSTPSNYG